MKPRVAALAVSIALVVGPVVAPTLALAGDRWRAHHRHRSLHGTVFVSPVAPRSCFGLVKHQHLLTFGCVTPRVISAPPVVYVPPVTYVPRPVVPYPVYAAPVAPSPPPLPRVIEYPTGRYELRGDGITTPYIWVWIPNPPPPPVAPPEPPPPARSPEPSPAAPMDSVAPSPPGEIYRWTDEQGVTNWTDRLDKVPERHRREAQRIG